MKRALRWALRIVAALVAALAIYAGAVWLATPSVRDLVVVNPRDTAFTRARGQVLGAWAPLEKISPVLACAVVKAEDRNFFHHRGFEASRLGSTITQQLAKNLFFGPERTLHRKLREAFAARALERTLDKRRILELYLNVIELGDGVWGVADGARRWLGVAPDQVDAFEAALLAGLIPAPRAPLESDNLDRLQRVHGYLLQRLAFAGLIDQSVHIAADERGRRFFARLRVGRSLAQALADTSGGPRTSSPVDLAQTLDSECGLARELEMAARFQARFHRP
jgi:membrane peptidoglycan carboxypeptidase